MTKSFKSGGFTGIVENKKYAPADGESFSDWCDKSTGESLSEGLEYKRFKLNEEKNTFYYSTTPDAESRLSAHIRTPYKEDSVMENIKKFDLQEALDGKPFIAESGNIGYILCNLKEKGVNVTYPQWPLAAYLEKVGYVSFNSEGKCRYSEHDIKGMYIAPAIFSDWDMIDEKWKYIAADSDWGDGESVYLYTVKPTWDYVEEVWYLGGESDSESIDASFFKKGLFKYHSPETSLLERPSIE